MNAMKLGGNQMNVILRSSAPRDGSVTANASGGFAEVWEEESADAAHCVAR
jgi:hypothetical protein